MFVWKKNISKERSLSACVRDMMSQIYTPQMPVQALIICIISLVQNTF